MELMKYITASKDAIYKGYRAFEAALMDYDVENEKLKKRVEQLTEDGMREAHQALIQKRDTAIDAARENTLSEVAKQRDGFVSVVSDYYRADGSKLDQNDVAILNSGFHLHDTELFDMIVKHRDNMTMLRQIYHYIRVNKMTGDVPTEYRKRITACVL